MSSDLKTRHLTLGNLAVHVRIPK